MNMINKAGYTTIILKIFRPELFNKVKNSKNSVSIFFVHLIDEGL